MPYIPKSMRKVVEEKGPVTPGELNYLVTKLVLEYVNTHAKNYTTYNDAIGALECAKLELYRRAVVPYEDKKCREAGDVYGD